MLCGRVMRLRNAFERASVLVAGASMAVTAACAVDAQTPEIEHNSAAVGFDFGGDCSSGSGHFTELIPEGNITVVGTIPPNKRNVRIELSSPADVDVQLVDEETGHQLIAWPSGDLNGPGEDCTTWQGVTYCYSGYNGDGVNYGHEWIEVRGDTNRTLVMRAYGYAAGNADVDYSWAAVPTCNEKGSGSFSQFIARDAVSDIGVIPAGVTNVHIGLTAPADLDVQLFDGDTAIVRWPDGLMNGAGEQTLEYQGMTITWSGYNGDGTGLGNEYIDITGRTTLDLTMKAFGYQAGTATVEYEWGVGAGSTCLGIGMLSCPEGLYCKNVQQDVVDPAGSCHAKNWCDPSTAVADCGVWGETMRLVEGQWSCEEFQCVYAPTVDLEWLVTNDEEIQGQLIHATAMARRGYMGCTEIGCSADNPCCNECNGSAAFEVNGRSITLEGIDITGNECTQEVVGGYNLDAGTLIDVTGTISMDSAGNITISVLTHRVALCEAPGDYPEYTVEEVATGTFAAGDEMQVRGTVDVALPFCTKMACQVENPCCNRCGASLFLTDAANNVVELEGLGCGGNECNYLEHCDLEVGSTSTVWGEAKYIGETMFLAPAGQCTNED